MAEIIAVPAWGPVQKQTMMGTTQDWVRGIWLAPKVNASKYLPIFLPEPDGWQYVPDTSINFKLTMDSIAERVCDQFRLGEATMRRKFEISEAIANALSDTIKLKPFDGPSVPTEVVQMYQEAMSNAAKNAEVSGNRVKMTIEIPVA